MRVVRRQSARAQREVYQQLLREAAATRIPPDSMTAAAWTAFRRSTAGQAALAAQARANGRCAAQRRIVLAAYRREHPDATDAQALAWLED